MSATTFCDFCEGGDNEVAHLIELDETGATICDVCIGKVTAELRKAELEEAHLNGYNRGARDVQELDAEPDDKKPSDKNEHGPMCECGHPEHPHLSVQIATTPYPAGCQVCDCKGFVAKKSLDKNKFDKAVANAHRGFSQAEHLRKRLGRDDKTDKVTIAWQCECSARGQVEIDTEVWEEGCATVLCPSCKRVIMQSLHPNALVQVK